MKKEDKGYIYQDIEEVFITDDRNIQENNIYDLKISLVKAFKLLEDKCGVIKLINTQIREKIGIIEEPEKSTDPEVLELIEERDKVNGEYRDLIDIANTIIDSIGQHPKSIKTDFFLNKYANNTQKASDFIDDRLSGENILSGTKKLFQSFAYSSEVKSYSPLNLYYAQHKLSKIFGIECELDY